MKKPPRGPGISALLLYREIIEKPEERLERQLLQEDGPVFKT